MFYVVHLPNVILPLVLLSMRIDQYRICYSVGWTIRCRTIYDVLNRTLKLRVNFWRILWLYDLLNGLYCTKFNWHWWQKLNEGIDIKVSFIQQFFFLYIRLTIFMFILIPFFLLFYLNSSVKIHKNVNISWD